jgi:F0F1-type ATP synthase assembly protein I
MIKSLFDHDDETPQPKENKSEIESEEAIKRQLDELNLLAETPGADDEIETITLPKIEQVYADADEPPPVNNTFPENQFFEVETQMQTPQAETATETEPPLQISTPTQYRNVLQNENATANESISPTENVSQTDTQPLTTAEALRQSGMAWSAAVGLFGSILFMLILGWFFDLLTGASPFGKVGGILIGAAIGFYQFFRTTSQIFKK